MEAEIVAREDGRIRLRHGFGAEHLVVLQALGDIPAGAVPG